MIFRVLTENTQCVLGDFPRLRPQSRRLAQVASQYGEITDAALRVCSAATRRSFPTATKKRPHIR